MSAAKKEKTAAKTAITLSKETVESLEEAAIAVKSGKCRIASLSAVLFDKNLIVSTEGFIVVDSKNAVELFKDRQINAGWYVINRKTRQLMPINEGDPDKLSDMLKRCKWHRRVFIYDADAIKKGVALLALDHGYDYELFLRCLEVESDPYSIDGARIAQIDTSDKAKNSKIKGIIRK
jgi:hypothetical protein